ARLLCQPQQLRLPLACHRGPRLLHWRSSKGTALRRRIADHGVGHRARRGVTLEYCAGRGVAADVLVAERGPDPDSDAIVRDAARPHGIGLERSKYFAVGIIHQRRKTALGLIDDPQPVARGLQSIGLRSWRCEHDLRLGDFTKRNRRQRRGFGRKRRSARGGRGNSRGQTQKRAATQHGASWMTALKGCATEIVAVAQGFSPVDASIVATFYPVSSFKLA